MPPPRAICRVAVINFWQARPLNRAEAAAVAVAAAAPVAAAAALYSAKFREDRGLAGLTYGGDPAMCAISRAQRLLLLLLDLESNLLSSSLAQWKKIWL